MRPTPSTDQLLRSCAEQINELIRKLPDETDRAAAGMIVVTLGNCAVRSAHEIAWMRGEAAEYRNFALEVAVALADPQLQRECEEPGMESLHLADVSQDYLVASHLMSRALRLAMASGRVDLITRAEDLLEQRLQREEEVRAAYTNVGR